MGHPACCTDPNCNLAYVEHLRGFGVASSAMPTRANPDTVATNIREKRWERDHAAFKRLKAEGLQPPHLDGAALREKQGETEWDIEHRRVDVDFSDPT